MKPTVGRIVHFTPSHVDPQNAKSQPWPAIITHVWSDECVNLCVFADGTYPAPAVAGPKTSINLRKTEKDAGCWEWPPRENA